MTKNMEIKVEFCNGFIDVVAFSFLFLVLLLKLVYRRIDIQWLLYFCSTRHKVSSHMNFDEF